MSIVTVNDASLSAIADAIREKLDVETTYLPSQMAAAIESIETGGTDLTSADEGKVVVEDDGDYVLQSQTSRSISQNGTYDTTTNDEVVVEVSSGGSVSDNDLLFHFDTDMRNAGKADTALINLTGLELSDEQSKFGTHSLKFLGTQTPNNFSLEYSLQFGTNDFTLDYWIYPTSLPSSSSYNVPVSFDYRSHAMYLSQTKVNYTFAKTSSSWFVNSTVDATVPTNEWVHIAVVRDGTSIYVFINGTKIDTADIGQNTIAPISHLTVGSNTYQSGDRRFSGYLDELRLKLGEAVWTDDFTPPANPYL